MELKNNLPLFIFEMANNHTGDVEHGKRIINEIADVCSEFNFKFAFKFQYRDLDTFIHPDFKNRDDIKYVKRFSETRLTEEEFLELRNEVSKRNFIAVCTPFDENSVDRVVNHNFDVIKIASCSFTDWPLLEKIVSTNKPIIASTAGSSLENIDNVVSFFEHRKKDFALMHCIGAYPTLAKDLQINQIDLLKQKYPETTIGFSTHEEPNNFDSIKIAIAKGAQIFERHVNVVSDKYSINGYSSTPNQIHSWLKAAKIAIDMCGVSEGRHPISDKEKNDLRGLKRGVFVKKDISKGDKITEENTFLAIPNVEGQIIANDLSKYNEFVATENIDVNKPILYKNTSNKNLRDDVLQIIKQLKKIIVESKLALPNKIELELSHHYGIEKYNEWGCAMLNLINREYCKKIIIVLPGQKHPIHHHVKKEETFQVLYGSMQVTLNGETKTLNAGDIVTVERNVKHSFSSEQGAIFEEVSTTHYVNDSFYQEDSINNNKFRKTQMTFWSDWLLQNIK